MRFLIIFVVTIATAAHAECENDYSGTLRSVGYSYEISGHANLARTPMDFVNAATNWLYLTDDGVELRGSMYGLRQPLGMSVDFPACNEIGQCANISLQGVPFVVMGFESPFSRRGYTIIATMNGESRSRFIQTDSAVAIRALSPNGAEDKRCRDNQGNLLDNSEKIRDEGDEDNEDEEEGFNDDDGEDRREDEGLSDEECESCEFFFDGDEDGNLNLDEPYGETEREV